MSLITGAMTFSLSKEIAQNEHRMAPKCTFIAYPPGCVSLSSYPPEVICGNIENETDVEKLASSTGVDVGDSQLKALAFQLVFKSRH